MFGSATTTTVMSSSSMNVVRQTARSVHFLLLLLCVSIPWTLQKPALAATRPNRRRRDDGSSAREGTVRAVPPVRSPVRAPSRLAARPACSRARMRYVPATAIVGAQWGDEGKGKIVDLLAHDSD